jgi:AcrR family transcriptional regulator
MARTKDPTLENRNREKIVATAKKLFMSKGFDGTAMKDIAEAVGMSKSTLYVYFNNKEAVKNYISLEAMQYLYHQLEKKVKPDIMNQHDCYMGICQVLVELKKKYPLSFQIIVEEICIDEKKRKEDAVLNQIYETGEKINQYIYTVLSNGASDIDEKGMFCNVFTQWGAIYGLIVLVENKQKYLKQSVHMTKEEFLQQGFERLFQSTKGAIK